jgi:hypothetical protein
MDINIKLNVEVWDTVYFLKDHKIEVGILKKIEIFTNILNEEVDDDSQWPSWIFRDNIKSEITYFIRHEIKNNDLYKINKCFKTREDLINYIK